MTTTEAMKQAQHLLRWTHFGECRTYPGPVPEAREVDKLLSEAIATEEAQGVESVYLVATGIVHEGNETYTQHDVCPPLCDAEKLFTHPDPPPADHIGDAAKLAGERAALIAQLSNDDTDMLRRKWFGHRNTGHLSFVEAVDATMEGLMAQQVAVPQGWKLLPVVATQEMLMAGFEASGSTKSGLIWRAMLAAAPQPPQADALAADHAEDVRVMVPMTEEQLATALNSYGSSGLLMRIARAVERHHKIGVKP